MSEDRGLTRKDMLIKKAIRDYSAKYGVGVNNYGSISNLELLCFMKDNKMGVRWISKNCIRTVRSKLPEQYREKLEE